MFDLAELSEPRRGHWGPERGAPAFSAPQARPAGPTIVSPPKLTFTQFAGLRFYNSLEPTEEEEEGLGWISRPVVVAVAAVGARPIMMSIHLLPVDLGFCSPGGRPTTVAGP